MSEGYRGIPIQRGRLVERDLLGEVRGEMPYQEGYVPYKEAQRWVMSNQPAQPTNPIKPFAHELRIALLDCLGFQTRVQFNKVRFYTAVGSALDHWHGIDAFIQVDADEDLRVPSGLITLGVTTRDKSDESFNTDVEIWVPNEGLDEISKKFDNGVQKVAKAIAKHLQGASAVSLIDLHQE